VNPTLDDLGEILSRIEDRRRNEGTLDRPFAVRTGVKGRIDADSITAAANLGVDGLIVMPHQLVPRGAPIYDLPLEDVLEGLPALVEQAGNA
jgi:hypothetical protein